MLRNPRNLWAVTLAIALVGSGGPAHGQDFTMSAHDSFSNNRSAIMGSHIARLNGRRTLPAGRSAPRYVQSGNGPLLAGAFAPTPPAAMPRQAALPFTSTPASRKQALEEFVARVERSDPRAAAEVGGQLSRYDATRIFAGIVRPFGLSANDLADVVTAYVVLGWMISNASPDPRPNSVRAVRARVAQELADHPQLRSPGMRSTVGEEVKILFVVLHSGMQNATRSKEVRSYSSGVRDMFRQLTGEDLRALTLTDRGFVGRG